MKRYFEIRHQGSVIAEIEIKANHLFHLSASISEVLRRFGLVRDDVVITSIPGSTLG